MHSGWKGGFLVLRTGGLRMEGGKSIVWGMRRRAAGRLELLLWGGANHAASRVVAAASAMRPARSWRHEATSPAWRCGGRGKGQRGHGEGGRARRGAGGRGAEEGRTGGEGARAEGARRRAGRVAHRAGWNVRAEELGLDARAARVRPPHVACVEAEGLAEEADEGQEAPAGAAAAAVGERRAVGEADAGRRAVAHAGEGRRAGRRRSRLGGGRRRDGVPLGQHVVKVLGLEDRRRRRRDAPLDLARAAPAAAADGAARASDEPPSPPPARPIARRRGRGCPQTRRARS